jgi:hypothetical protein
MCSGCSEYVERVVELMRAGGEQAAAPHQSTKPAPLASSWSCICSIASCADESPVTISPSVR